MDAKQKHERQIKGFTLAKPVWIAPVSLFLFIFFVLPLLANIVRSSTIGRAKYEGIFFYYSKLFTDQYYLSVIAETLAVSLVTTVACLVIGYPIAFFLVRYAKRWSTLVVFCLIAPLLTSIIMRTFGWNVLFARRGLFNLFLQNFGIIERPIEIVNTPLMVYIGLVHVLVPFMVISISSVLQTVDIRLEEAARILGANRFKAFLSISLPLSRDGIASGCMLVFVLTNGSFLTMLLLGNGSVSSLSLLIYQQFNITQDVGFASAMGNILLAVALIAVGIQSWFLNRGVKI